MPHHLSGQDQHSLVTLWHDVGEQPDLFDAAQLLTRLAELVPCDYASVNEIDELHGVALSRYLPSDAADHADYQAFRWHVHEHPLLRAARVTGDGQPRRLSEVAGPEQWHRLGIYGEYFRPMRVEHQVGFTGGDPDAVTAAVLVFNRAAHDFDDRDMAVFRAVHPLFQLVHRLTVERRRTAAARVALERPGHGVTVLGPLGHVESIDDVSVEAMTIAFDVVPSVGALAPAALVGWSSGDSSSRTFDAQGVSVVVRRGPSISDRRSVLFETVRQPPEHGLTPREREVVALVAEGGSNRAAARQLGISSRTVEKHLERAYLKLGVENRTSAARAVSGPSETQSQGD